MTSKMALRDSRTPPIAGLVESLWMSQRRGRILEPLQVPMRVKRKIVGLTCAKKVETTTMCAIDIGTPNWCRFCGAFSLFKKEHDGVFPNLQKTK